MSRARYPRKYGSRISCEAEVEIDVDEVIEQLDTDDLVEELERRNVSRSLMVATGIYDRDYVERALDALMRKDYADATVLLERALHPYPTKNVEADYMKGLAKLPLPAPPSSAPVHKG